MMNRKNLDNLLGCLPKALLGNFLIGALALLLGIALGGPKIFIEPKTAWLIFCLILAIYAVVTWWSVGALAGRPAGEDLVTSGPYRFSRHPMYAAIIFLLNPALAVLFRSWLLLLAAIPIYFFWRRCVRAEERTLAAKFGAAYSDYQKAVRPFFPGLRRLNIFLFYGAAAVLLFSGSFIFLNASALYLRWVAWEDRGRIVYDQRLPVISSWPKVVQDLPGGSQYSLPSAEPMAVNRADYNESGNGLLIEKLGVRAPLVQAAGTTQKELNSALNLGVILYPGSAWPGQNGEVVISGHSSVFPWVKTQYGQVFTLLDKLEAGDTISLVYNHRQYDYRVTGQKVLLPSQVVISDTDQPVLKLVTCWPVGTANKRLVVYAELIK